MESDEEHWRTKVLHGLAMFVFNVPLKHPSSNVIALVEYFSRREHWSHRLCVHNCDRDAIHHIPPSTSLKCGMNIYISFFHFNLYKWNVRNNWKSLTNLTFCKGNCLHDLPLGDEVTIIRTLRVGMEKMCTLRIIGPSKLAILRTLPLLYRFKPFHWRVQDP